MTTLLHADWCPMDLNAEVLAPHRGSPDDRSPAELTAIVGQFADQARYAARDVTGDDIDETFCNFFVREVLRALGVDVPRGRVNDIIAHFETSKDWAKVPAWIARDLATKAGRPAIAVWKNPNPARSGHITIVVPTRNELDTDHVFIAQAGNTNFVYGKLESGFGNLAPVFYARR